MGDRRTGDRALGLVAVRLAGAGRAARLMGAVLMLGGCSAVADLSALATGAAAGGATASPAVGFAVGVVTDAAVDAGLKYVSRRRQQAEQDAIAAAAAPLSEGGSAPWQIRHDIPLGNEEGEVRVVRSIVNPIATCKEIAFSVTDDPPAPPSWFSTTICRQDTAWKWALAEPAVSRWGFLQ